LEDFKQIQKGNVNSTVVTIQTWEAKIESTIRGHLDSIGKGWFSLEVSSKES